MTVTQSVNLDGKFEPPLYWNQRIFFEIKSWTSSHRFCVTEFAILDRRSNKIEKLKSLNFSKKTSTVLKNEMVSAMSEPNQLDCFRGQALLNDLNGDFLVLQDGQWKLCFEIPVENAYF